MSFGTVPKDAGGIPISSVYSPGEGFIALQGAPGGLQDSSSNTSTPVIIAFAPPAIVQKAHNVTGSGAKTLTCAFGNNNIAGNSIVVVVGIGEVEGANIALAITDSNSNTYTKAVSAAQSTTFEAAIFYATNVVGASNTITVTISGSSSSNAAIAVEIYEVAGTIAVSSAILDATSTGNNAGSTSPATGSVSPVVPCEIAFAGIAAAGGTVSAGTNWALDSGSLAPTGGGIVSFGSESQTLGTITSITASGTLSSSNAWAIALATFKPVISPVEGSFNLAQVGGSAVALGQTTMASSVPVTMASNQSDVKITVDSITASLSQANQIPVSPAGQQGLLTLSISSLTANADNSITFSGNATVARRIRIQNESSGTIYWNADAAASTGTPSLASPAANAVMVEWVNQSITTLHIFIPSGGTTTLNGSSGVKVSAWA